MANLRSILEAKIYFGEFFPLETSVVIMKNWDKKDFFNTGFCLHFISTLSKENTRTLETNLLNIILFALVAFPNRILQLKCMVRDVYRQCI